MRGFLAGTRALVHAPEQAAQRHLADVRAIIQASLLDPAVKQGSLRVFTLLAEAEGQVHGVAPEQVHFHEVGALDAIVDIVGVVAGLRLLGVEAVYASALPLGHGWARAAHGQLPLPAPATLALLAAVGAPTLPTDTAFELVTPTGAALLAALATFDRPPMRVLRVGYGLGKRDLARPNALRVWLGPVEPAGWGREASAAPRPEQMQVFALPASGHTPQASVLIETNIDDQPAEQLAYTAEQLLALGALDAWLTPIVMKKGRAAVLLSALVPPELEDAAVALIMRETTTLGVRRRLAERHVCDRSIATVATPLGPIRMKHKRWQGDDMGAAPEYEDCARLAREHGLPLREVYRLALDAL